MKEAPYRKEKIQEVVLNAASQFIQQESNGQSLITVTNVDLSSDFHNATIFVTVLPDETEDFAVEFLKRKLGDFRDFVKKKTRLQYIPWFTFAADKGQKSRLRVDEISEELEGEK